MSTANKLTYLNGTKQVIKQAINEDFEVIDNNTTFREYADEISSNNASYKALIPKETKNATNTLDISNSAGLDKALVTQYGNTYQEGEPTPDIPQEIVNISGKSTLKDVGKNLFDKDNANVLNAYINGSSGVITTDNNSRSIYIQCKPNTTYTIQKILTTRFRVGYSSDTPVIGTTLNGVISNYDGTTITITTGNNTKYLVVWICNIDTATLQEVLDSIQIEENSTASTYETYKEQSFGIDLPIGIELCKIDTYKDRIYPLNGKWYLEKNIGKVVLDGSENWIAVNTISYSIAKSDISNWGVSAYDTTLWKNTHFTKVSAQQSSTQGTAWVGNNYINFNYDNSNSNITSFKTWLSTHNTTVYYVLATPITTEITESNYPTLYNQLNNIKLFEGVNHITMTNESGLDVEFDIEYYKDWKLD